MGNSQPLRSRRTSSPLFYDRKSYERPDILKKINEKEYTFIAMQSEIDRAIAENNRKSMKSLEDEIAAHIVDLNQLKTIALTSTNRGRTQKIIYNFELALAKVKSIYNSDTALMKERNRHFSPSDSSSFHVEPIHQVEPDLIRFDSANSLQRSFYRENRSTLPNVPEIANSHPLTRSNSLYSNQHQTFEESFVTIESEFNVLKDQVQRPVEDVNEYYQMDKGVFYLYVKVRNLELSDPVLNERKFKLIKELADFRTTLDKKSGELEEQRELEQEINTLELLLDSTSENEIANLRAKALILQETIETTSWNPHFTQRKMELLRRLAKLMEIIAYTSPSPSMDNSVEHIYGNLNSLPKERNILKDQQETNLFDNNQEKQSTNLVENNELEEMDNSFGNAESIYGNVETIKQEIESKSSRNLHRTGSNVSQRGTVYVNADIVKQNSPYENHFLQFDDSTVNKEVITKRPLPLPRNYDDKVINDLPKHWQRLNELFDKESLSDTDKVEIADIQRYAEVAKSLFERKIKKIVEKFEDSIEL